MDMLDCISLAAVAFLCSQSLIAKLRPGLIWTCVCVAVFLVSWKIFHIRPFYVQFVLFFVAWALNYVEPDKKTDL